MRFVWPLVATLLVPSAASAADAWSDPFPGVRRLHRTTPTQNINALVVDLCAPGVIVRATQSDERQQTVPAFGALVNAQAAINGDFFSYSNYETTGPARGANGTMWGGGDDTFNAPALFGHYRVALPGPGSTAGITDWARNVVSGHPSIVVGGELRDYPTYDLCTADNPRTALGFSADRHTLYLVVVDGRATGRNGMSCSELGSLIKGLGAADAINLDGGGSSTMWLAGSGVVNFPSDGSPRVVANHLAIRATGEGEAYNCPDPTYAATVATREAPTEMVSGQDATMALELENTGNASWDPMRTQVGTQDPPDRASAFFVDGDWLSASRPTVADAGPFGPGKLVRFTWTMRAPEVDQSTRLMESFQLVHEDGWFGPVETMTIVVHPRAGPTDLVDDPPTEPGGCSATGGGSWLALIAALAFVLVARARRQRFV